MGSYGDSVWQKHLGSQLATPSHQAGMLLIPCFFWTVPIATVFDVLGKILPHFCSDMEYMM